MISFDPSRVIRADRRSWRRRRSRRRRRRRPLCRWWRRRRACITAHWAGNPSLDACSTLVRIAVGIVAVTRSISRAIPTRIISLRPCNTVDALRSCWGALVARRHANTLKQGPDRVYRRVQDTEICIAPVSHDSHHQTAWHATKHIIWVVLPDGARPWWRRRRWYRA